MTYRCGIESSPPRVTCDGCGDRLVVNQNRLPPKWLINNRPPPRWEMEREVDTETGIVRRRDWCPLCKQSIPAIDTRQPTIDEHW